MSGRPRQRVERPTRTARVRRFAALVSFALLAACAAAPQLPSAFERDFDDETKGWQEIQAQLPAVPKDDDLVVFGVSGATQFRFAIDAYSLSIGSDDVFRYVIVATSPQGARNVSYEGVRCRTHERKIYATGRSDGTWVRARKAAWAPIEEVGNNRQHAALMKEYFCPDGYPARNVAEVLGRMHVRLPSTVL